jgi:hypothetical protein
MKWTEQLVHSEKLFGWLLTKDSNSSKVIKRMVDFTKDEIDKKYAVYADEHVPTLILLETEKLI